MRRIRARRSQPAACRPMVEPGDREGRLVRSPPEDTRRTRWADGFAREGAPPSGASIGLRRIAWRGGSTRSGIPGVARCVSTVSTTDVIASAPCPVVVVPGDGSGPDG